MENEEPRAESAEDPNFCVLCASARNLFSKGLVMSALAEAVYEILRRRVGLSEPRITYAELAAALRDWSEEFEYTHHRNPQLYTALGEVGRECRRLRLPPLPALVVRADTRRPGEAYYRGRRSGRVYKDDQISAWRRDLEAVRQATYPARGDKRRKMK